MADEEAALIVDQQLVELGGDRLAHAEAGGGAVHDLLERPWPVLAGDPDPVGADLPGAADGGVHQGVGAAPIRGPLGGGDQLCRLHRQQRQGDRPDAVDLDAGCQDVDPAGGAEVAGPADRAQDFGEIIGDRRQAIVHLASLRAGQR